MTIELSFTPEIIEIINEERYRHPVPLVQRRMEALWLKSHGLPHAQIAQLVTISENTLRDYFQLYLDGGLEKVREVHFYRPESQLMGHLTSLEAHFRAHPPASIKQAQSEIEALTGIHRSESQVREFLKKTALTLSESRHDPGQSRSRGTGGLPQRGAGAAFGRGAGGQTGGVFRGCGPLCLGPVFGISVEHQSSVY